MLPGRDGERLCLKKIKNSQKEAFLSFDPSALANVIAMICILM